MPLQLTQKMIFRYQIFDRDHMKPELLTFCPCQHILPTLSFLLFYHAVQKLGRVCQQLHNEHKLQCVGLLFLQLKGI